MTNINNMPIDLSADSKIVQDTLKQAGIVEGKNGGEPQPVGSSKKIITPKTNPAPEPLKSKEYKVQLDPAQQARLEREAFASNHSDAEHLQSIVDEKLSTGVGAPFVTSANWMGSKVTAPSNTKPEVRK